MGRLGASVELAYRHSQQAMCAHMYPEAPSHSMDDGLKPNLWDSMSQMFGSSTRGAKSELCEKLCSGEAGSMWLCRCESLAGHRPLHADMPSPKRSISVRWRAARALGRTIEEVPFHKKCPQGESEVHFCIRQSIRW